MNLPLPRILRMVYLFSSLKNKVLNLASRLATGKRVSIDWRDLRILHPEAMSIGDRFSSGKGLWLESVDGQGQLVIGERVNLSDHVHIGCASKVTIGSGVLIGSKVLITDHSHGAIDAHGPQELHLAPNLRKITSRGAVWIGDDVWIGDGVCVLQGVSIGAGAIVGANSVVTRDIPERTVWGGIPARQLWPAASDVLEQQHQHSAS